MAKTRVDFEKVSNGFIISKTTEITNKRGFTDFKTDKFVEKTAKETQDRMTKLMSDLK